MSDTHQPHPPLGVGDLIGASFSLVFSNLTPMMIIAAIPAVAGLLLNLIVYGPISLNPTLAITDPIEYMAATQHVPQYVSIVLSVVGLVLWGFAAVAITHAAFTARAGEPVSIGRAISTGFRRIGPVILCMLIGGIAIYIGIIFLIVPGLYLCALWFVIIPAIVIDNEGVGSFGRSARLTQEYRWPLVGLLLLYTLILLAVLALSFGLQFASTYLDTAGLALSTISGAVFATLIYAVGGTLTALTYARLREIKEGVGVQSLANVFS